MRTTSDDPGLEGPSPQGPPQGRPPLTKRLGSKHWAALDYLAGAVTTVVLFAEVKRGLARATFPPPFGTPHYWPMSLAGPLAVLVVLAAGFAVALRRRRPVFMLGVLLVGSFIVGTLTVPDGSGLVYFVPVAYVLYLVAATYEERRDAVRVLVAVYITLMAVAVVLVIGGHGAFNGSAMIPVALLVIIAWTIGYSVRQRRGYAVRLQDEAASKAVAQERLRIARELHDVVAHSMSVIAVQAGYGQYVIDSQPGDARDALGAIQTTSREALEEMRRMLGALRHADEGDALRAGAHGGAGAAAGAGAGAGGSGAGLVGGSSAGGAGAPLFPAPGLADMDRLVSRTASAGVQVEVKRAGQPRDLPASIDLSAYRIVQEALTNVVKHAQTGSCQVMIDYGYDLLTIEVTDNGAGVPVSELASTAANGGALLARNGSAARGLTALDGTGVRPDGSLTRHAFGRDAARFGRGALGGGAGSFGEGHGIIGMRERVTLLGGNFSAGPLPGYGFQVSARIPLPPLPERSA